jgi:GT2 family glycosyltransferase
MARLSAITVNFGGSSFLERAVASLLPSLTREAGELLVYDNGPEDEGLRRIVESSPLVRLVAGERNVSFAKANNICAAESTGERILFFNPDVQAKNEAVSALLRFLEDNVLCGAVGPRLVSGEGAIEVSRAADPGILSETALRLLKSLPLSLRSFLWERKKPVRTGWVSAAAMLVRRDVFEGVGGFDERFPLYFEDADLCYRIRSAGWQVWYSPLSTMIHSKGHAADPKRDGRKEGFSRTELAYRQGQLLYYAKRRGPAQQALLRAYLKRKLRHHPAALDELFHWANSFTRTE